MTQLILIMDVTDGIDGDALVDDINCELLCRLEEDDKKITGWEWLVIRKEEDQIELLKQ
jgi:hypothetical protein